LYVGKGVRSGAASASGEVKSSLSVSDALPAVSGRAVVVVAAGRSAIGDVVVDIDVDVRAEGIDNVVDVGVGKDVDVSEPDSNGITVVVMSGSFVSCLSAMADNVYAYVCIRGIRCDEMNKLLRSV